MTATPSTPCGFYDDGSILRTRDRTGQNFFGAAKIFALDEPPFRNPEERVRPTSGMGPGKERRCLGSLILMKADTEFPGVGSVDKKPRLKLRVKRIVGQGDNIAQLLPDNLLRSVDERERCRSSSKAGRCK